MACERCIAATLEVFASGRLLFVWMTETVLRGETRMFAPRDARWLGERRRVPRNKPFSPRAAGFGWLRDFKSSSSRSFSAPAGARTAGGNRHDMGAGCGRCQEAARDGERAGALLRGGGGGSAARKRGGATHAGETELRFKGGGQPRKRREGCHPCTVKPNSGSRAGSQPRKRRGSHTGDLPLHGETERL